MGGDAPSMVPDPDQVGSHFESSRHRHEVIQCIAAGTLPLKFAYAGSAAYTHDRLARSDGYRHVIGPVELEVGAMRQLWAPEDMPERMVEIGPGNGMHSAALLTALLQAGTRCRHYLGVDFSFTLLDLACTRLRSALGPVIAVGSALWDVEAAPTMVVECWRGDSSPLLVGMLGQTLGNVENVSDTLENIYQSTRAGDVLVATLTLRQPHTAADDILAPYRSADFRAAALEPLRAAGVDLSSVGFGVRVVDDVVIGEAVFAQPITVDDVAILAGHVLRCFLSRRFTPDEVPALFERVGWSVENTVLDDEREHIVVIATRTDGDA